tara:strand:+ start:481 stop:909 length:429 start_codon:yes stop_codon:yes gene_type:complete
MERALFILIGQYVAIAGRNLMGVYKGLGRKYFAKDFSLDVVIRQEDKLSVFLAFPLVEGLSLAEVQDPFVHQLISNTIESVLNNIDLALSHKGVLDSSKVDYVDDRYTLYMEVVYQNMSEEEIERIIYDNQNLITQSAQKVL